MILEEFSIDKAIKEIEEFLETLKEAVIIEDEVKFPKEEYLKYWKESQE